jgi:hypothetical protein
MVLFVTKGVFGRAPRSSRSTKTAPLHFFHAKHPSSKNSRSTKSMDLAPNSTKSMECLKGYSAKACFALTRGVGWKLPTIATHYTTYRFNSYSRDSLLTRSSPPSRDPSPSSSTVAAPPPVLSGSVSRWRLDPFSHSFGAAGDQGIGVAGGLGCGSSPTWSGALPAWG